MLKSKQQCFVRHMIVNLYGAVANCDADCQIFVNWIVNSKLSNTSF